MSMSAGGGGGLSNEINVTPMIDVLLVLLIIFMAVLPSMRKAIDIQLPDPNPTVAAGEREVRIRSCSRSARAESIAINSEAVTRDRPAGAVEGDLRPAPGEDHFREGRAGREIRRHHRRDGRRARCGRQDHRCSAEGHARQHARRRPSSSARLQDSTKHPSAARGRGVFRFVRSYSSIVGQDEPFFATSSYNFACPPARSRDHAPPECTQQLNRTAASVTHAVHGAFPRLDFPSARRVGGSGARCLR